MSELSARTIRLIKGQALRDAADWLEEADYVLVPEILRLRADDTEAGTL